MTLPLHHPLGTLFLLKSQTHPPFTNSCRVPRQGVAGSTMTFTSYGGRDGHSRALQALQTGTPGSPQSRGDTAAVHRALLASHRPRVELPHTTTPQPAHDTRGPIHAPALLSTAASTALPLPPQNSPALAYPSRHRRSCTLGTGTWKGLRYLYVARHLAAATYIKTVLVERYGGQSCSGRAEEGAYDPATRADRLVLGSHRDPWSHFVELNGCERVVQRERPGRSGGEGDDE
jgi:hypothetical protein